MSEYKPIVKWAGGKSKVVNQLLMHLPKKFNSYHEPFVGGAAVFFTLFQELMDDHANVYLYDLNEELINLYKIIKDDVDDLIITAKKHVYDEEYYYRLRAADLTRMTVVERAARTLYLNKTCFNGLYRVNNKGQFNVPFGYYINPIIVNEAVLRNANHAFNKVHLIHGDFELSLENTVEGDLIYFDPPYVPLSATSGFTHYTSGSFSLDDQQRLKLVFEKLMKKGCYVMLSNSDTTYVKNLYADYNIKKITATRSINSNKNKRGAITELLVLSYQDSEAESSNSNVI